MQMVTMQVRHLVATTQMHVDETPEPAIINKFKYLPNTGQGIITNECFAPSILTSVMMVNQGQDKGALCGFFKGGFSPLLHSQSSRCQENIVQIFLIVGMRKLTTYHLRVPHCPKFSSCLTHLSILCREEIIMPCTCVGVVPYQKTSLAIQLDFAKWC